MLPPSPDTRSSPHPSRWLPEAFCRWGLRLLVCGLLIVLGDLPRLAQAFPSPRQLKQDAISALEQITTTDPKLQRTIAQAIRAISRSLVDNGQPFFLDESRILPPPRGQKVFQRERQAVGRLLEGLARPETPTAIQTVFQQVIAALVSADREIAALSIASAERLVQTGAGDARELAQAQREFAEALRETDSRKAIQGFRKAWEASQEVVEDRELFITTFQDAPDPFSPSLTTNTLTATFQVREKGELRHEKEQTQFVLEFVELIQDSANATVRRLTTRQVIALPPEAPKERFFDVTVTSAWDGRNENGEIVPDGTYAYLAFGHLIRVKSDGAGRAEERIRATAFPVSGTILLDNTPPVITTATSPAPNANGWNSTDVTVSFAATDSLSGIEEVTAPITLTAEGANQVVTGTATDVAGNSATASVTVNLDKTPPSVGITSPADGTTLSTSPVTVTGTITEALSGVASVTCNNTSASLSESTFTCDLALTEGANPILVQATDIAGNTGSTSLSVSFIPGGIVLPVVSITSPANLSLFNASPIAVSGTVDDPNATVVVNGIAATVSAGSFTATGVPLREGSSIITATATNATGNVGTASITVALDTTPPTVLIDTPTEGAILTQSVVTVTGKVNDIVTGTGSGDEPTVTVNGVAAVVSNGSFIVPDLPLKRGPNIINATAEDRAGNASVQSVQVTVQELVGQRINLVSGNNQTGVIGTTLTNPLVVALTDANGDPVAGRPVTFTVSRGDGILSAGTQQGRRLNVSTDATGQAAVSFTLGSRSGAGNQRVTATAAGFVGEVIFCASAIQSAPTQIKIVSGETQRGVVGQSLPRPLVVFVHDAGGNPVTGVPVSFQVARGGGTIGGSNAVTVPTNPEGRAVAVLTLGTTPGINNNLVQASFAGLSGLPAIFVASGVLPGPPAETKVSGVVLDNSNLPIAGVTASIEGTTLQAVTNTQGQLTISNVPVGTHILRVDGTTTTRPGVWPALEFEIVTITGQDNTIGMPIFLLPLDAPNAKIVGGSQDVTLTMRDVPGFALTVFANSATFADGSTVGQVMVTQVHADKVPMPPIAGAAPRLVWTVQPAGVLFDPPARITYPNIDNLKPGQVVDIFSFDHDLGEFVNIGTGTVSEDGSVITSDPGAGIRKSGWGYPQPPPPPTSTADVNQCDKSAQDTANLAQEFATTNPNAAPWTNIQACIARNICDRASPGGPDFQDNTWAEAITEKFVGRFVDGVKDPNSPWQAVLETCKSPVVGFVLCSAQMALQHIQKDLPDSLLMMEDLKKEGLVQTACGRDLDWDTIFGDIQACVNNEPGLLELSKRFGPAAVRFLRDRVQRSCRQTLGE